MANVFFYLLTFNFRAGIMNRYNFNQVRWFCLTFSIDFINKPVQHVKIINSQFSTIYIYMYIYIYIIYIYRER